jgi:ATP-dependent RNA helicase RhlE
LAKIRKTILGTPQMPFSSLKLSTQIQKALTKNNFIKPTPIQEKVIPLALDGKDIMAKAKTGSGKSASYILPILEMLQKRRGEGKAKIKVLVLTPTRELTLQIAKTFENFGEFQDKRVSVVSLIGGEGIGDQLFDIQQGCDVLVATSGRFLDVLSKKQMNLSHLEFLVLDEADKMLNLGFAQELDLILEAIPAKRQNLLFSATYPEKILNIASKITNDPVEVSIEEDVPTVDTITQRVIEVDVNNRGSLLKHLIKTLKLKNVLVFMANKRATDNIAFKFRKQGFAAESFHGDLNQEDRTYTLDEFKANKINILFATDIAARGLDIQNIECVINYDLPRSPTDYIQTVTGTLTFTQEDQDHFEIIEKKCKVKIPREQIEGFELTGETPKKEKGPAPVKGKGKSKKDKLREQALQGEK